MRREKYSFKVLPLALFIIIQSLSFVHANLWYISIAVNHLTIESNKEISENSVSLFAYIKKYFFCVHNDDAIKNLKNFRRLAKKKCGVKILYQFSTNAIEFIELKKFKQFLFAIKKILQHGWKKADKHFSVFLSFYLLLEEESFFVIIRKVNLLPSLKKLECFFFYLFYRLKFYASIICD